MIYDKVVIYIIILKINQNENPFSDPFNHFHTFQNIFGLLPKVFSIFHLFLYQIGEEILCNFLFFPCSFDKILFLQKVFYVILGLQLMFRNHQTNLQ